ncbi:TrkH family potassium uptake protein [Desulfosarcina sp.]|uniref:TrkH family potassium uptake protein n=1 Tax=Desulfosarcina sp. TaxID=2027861 RepID=UPI003970A82A
MSDWFHNRLNRAHPTNLLLLSYVAAIAVGTLALMLPAATVSGDIRVIDALFTATSAVCVTGLIVVDTGSYFTAFGQGIILFLIQIGGLGIMTISVALFQVIGKKVVFQQRMAMQEVFSHTPREDIFYLIRSVLFFTFTVEVVGAVILFFYWRSAYPLGEALYKAVFHSVSAFCNAGFSQFSDSLTAGRASMVLNLTVCTLIILGGIGFPVVYEIYRRVVLRQSGKVSIQTKSVISASVGLVVAGMAVIVVSERTLIPTMGWGQGLLAAFFQAVTCRTAGFNTLDIASLNTATLLFMMFLMLVGASPGSCGGGMKTTTFAVLTAFSWSRLMRYKCVNLFGKTVPEDTVAKSISVLVFSLAAICVAVFLILFLDPDHGTRVEGDRQFMSFLFETVSAFGTVGLSMGVTPTLTQPGKLVIIALMVIGRVGVPAFTYIIAGGGSTKGVQYAEENMMIG